MSGRDSSGLSLTRTSSASRTHPCICSMARTSDDCETSKSTWASGPRTIDSEAPGEMRWKWRLGLLAIAGLEVPLLLWTSTADGRVPRNSPLRGRHSGAGPDGDAPRPAPLLHLLGRVAWRPDGIGVVSRPLPAADRGARTRRDPFHSRFRGGCARPVPRARLRPSTETVDSALRCNRCGGSIQMGSSLPVGRGSDQGFLSEPEDWVSCDGCPIQK